MYKESFDSNLPTHKRVGKKQLVGPCDNCGLEVTLDISMNSIRFIDSFTNSDLCFTESKFNELATSARKWRNSVNKFNSGEAEEALSDSLEAEKIEKVEIAVRELDSELADVLSAYADLYSRTPNFDEKIVENIYSPISLI